MDNIKLDIAKLKSKAYPFGVVAGKSILGKYKTEGEARKQLKDNRVLFEYWAESASVSVDNSKKNFVILN